MPQCNLRSAYDYLTRRVGYVFTYEFALLEETEKQRLLARQRECDTLKSALDFGRPVTALPLMSIAKFKAEGRASRWVSCNSLVFDLSTFHKSHPGGQTILEPFYGNDITRAFNGAVYNHSNAARNLSRHFMIARLAAVDAHSTESSDSVPAAAETVTSSASTAEKQSSASASS